MWCISPHACIMYCRERTSTRETVETKMWNKIFIFVFFAQKVFSWLRKITVDRLMSHGLLCRSSWYFSGPWSCKDPCCLWEDQRALRYHQKYLNLCSEDERRSYGFGTTSGWVINDRILIFGWTIPLTDKQGKKQCDTSYICWVSVFHFCDASFVYRKETQMAESDILFVFFILQKHNVLFLLWPFTVTHY